MQFSFFRRNKQLSTGAGHRRLPDLHAGLRARRGAAKLSAAVWAKPIESLEQRTLLAASTGDGGDPTSGLPSATLAAPSLKMWGPTYTFTVTYLSNKRIRTAQLDNKDITVTGPNGYSRPARLVGYVDNVKQVIARYKASTPNSVWNASDNGTYRVNMNGKQVSDGANRYVAAGQVGTFTAALAAFPSDVGVRPQAVSGGVDVTRFGAIANDGIDDTIAIQKAIDSLPRANGVADSTTVIGGNVWFPAGTFNTSGTLNISSGVVLRGQGAFTVINNSSTDRNSAAIRLVSYFSHGYIMQSGVENLAIFTSSAKGIQGTKTVGSITGLTVSGVTISSGGAAIDLRGCDVYQAVIENISINNPGSTALWLTVGTENSAIDRIDNFVVQGNARSNFVAEQGMIVLGGDVTVNNMVVGDVGATVTPLYVTGGGVTFKQLALQQSSSSLPDGVVARFDKSHARIDQLSLGASRRIVLTGSPDVQIETANMIDNSALSSAVSVDGSSHLTLDTYRTNDGLGSFSPLRVTVRNIAPWSALTTFDADPAPKAVGAVSQTVVDVTAFGAKPNDNVDDTLAIQKAIDSLPKGNGLTNTAGSGIVGGTVLFAEGNYTVDATLFVPSGVWLQGQGSGTVLTSHALGFPTSTIELVSGATAGFNVGAGISDLTIHTESTIGIHASAALTGGLFDFNVRDVLMSAGGVGIDLHDAKAFHTRMLDVSVLSPGSAALWLGDAAGYSSDNVITSFKIQGSYRPNYVDLGAQIMVSGQSTLSNFWMEVGGATNLPLRVSGAAKLSGFWMEYAATLPDSVLASFENCYSLDIDRFVLLDTEHKIRFRNTTGARIDFLDMQGTSAPLSQILDLDDSSHVAINTIRSSFDAGMLDDPRVSIAGVYSAMTSSFIDTSLVTDGISQGLSIADNVAKWQVRFGDSAGQVFGTYAVSTDGDMIVSISGNPNRRQVNIIINLNVSDSMVGKRAIAYYRVDGPGTTVLYNKNWHDQYNGRAVNSLTAVVSPTTLQKNDQLIIQLPSVSSGTFVIKQLGLMPIG